ncbi:MAG: hypothetical protein E7408_01460 [Ruminococcaceae bacterium]|nr:hypothetical protein [Oscillospiraceae bacterium]
MKRITRFLCILLCFTLFPVLHCSANEESVQGYISDADAVQSLDGCGVEVLVLTPDSMRHTYTIKRRVNFDGTSFSLSTDGDCEQLAADIRENFAEVRVNASQIIAITRSEYIETIQNAEYNPATGRFAGVDKALPIFETNGEYIPYLDGNHVYDIEVYSDMVNITEMRAKNGMKTVMHIYGSERLQSDFLHTLWVDFETTAGTAVCKGRLSADGGFSQGFEEVGSDGYGMIGFRNLPNQTKLYTVSFQLEKADGTPLTPVYTYTHRITEVPILHGYIVNAAPVTDINGTHLELLIRDSNRTESNYKITDAISINNNVCAPWENEAEWTSLIGKFVKAAVSDDCLQGIYYETTPTRVSGGEYDPASGRFSDIDSTLPIFYECGEYIPYLDENHTYELDVYSYAVNITDMTAKNGLVTIARVNMYQSAQDNFLLFLGADFEITAAAETIQARLYDAAGRLLKETEENIDGTYGFMGFRDLPNQNKDYSVSWWLEDNGGNRISLPYTFTYSTNAVPVYSGYMDAAVIVSNISGEGIEFRITNPKEGDLVFRCASRILLNGNSFRIQSDNVEEIEAQIRQLTQVECMCDENGEVNVIRSAVMQRAGKDCSVSDAVVYKESFAAEVQFEETYTGSSALVLIALYDETGKLTGWSFETVEVPADKSEAVSVSAPIDASEKYTDGKVFLWQTLLSPTS